MNEDQTSLQEETVRCLECGAFRSAAVMGWNLAYDYIRRWACTETPADRFQELRTGLNRANYRRREINSYSDFYERNAPIEAEVIDAMDRCRHGTLIGGNIAERLRMHLQSRNKYAHATEKTASGNKTNAYIEELIDTITTTPFSEARA